MLWFSEAAIVGENVQHLWKLVHESPSKLCTQMHSASLQRTLCQELTDLFDQVDRIKMDLKMALYLASATSGPSRRMCLKEFGRARVNYMNYNIAFENENEQCFRYFYKCNEWGFLSSPKCLTHLQYMMLFYSRTKKDHK